MNARYGIDLGTTNSLIARWEAGKVEVIRNPHDMWETLPSVVSYRKGRVVVGTAARAFLDKSPEDVFGGFKRRMGSTDLYPVKAIGRSVSPVELSAEVLRELRLFVSIAREEQVDEAVITVPASFDATQSDATLRAGRMAGFTHIELLQEPVAAALAAINVPGFADGTDRRWLVYDLGGGTFDAALIDPSGRNLQVVDHEGDNFLGGRDLDEMIVDQFILPALATSTGWSDLNELRRASSRHNQLYYRLLHVAEQARIELSSRAEAFVEFDLLVDSQIREISVPIKRSEFDKLVLPWVDRSVALVRGMIDRHAGEEISRVVLVGGTTYTPLVRRRVQEALGLPVFCSIDPTTAIAIGAAYYAGARTRPATRAGEDTAGSPTPVVIRVAAPATSHGARETLAIQAAADPEGRRYRITRRDGGYDSGWKPLKRVVTEDVPLVLGAFNVFEVRVSDEAGNVLEGVMAEVCIAQGQSAIEGQPLPHDICIEVDDALEGRTHLAAVFTKNSVLPLTRSLTRPTSITLTGDPAAMILLNVYEGSSTSLPEASRRIGQLRIGGDAVTSPVVQGSDIELSFEIDRSRQISVSARLQMTGQTFSQVFKLEDRHIDAQELQSGIQRLLDDIANAEGQAEEDDDEVVVFALRALDTEATALLAQASDLAPDDMSDRKFQIDDRRRALVSKVGGLTAGQRIRQARRYYDAWHSHLLDVVGQWGTPGERARVASLIQQHGDLATSGNPLRIDHARREIAELACQIQTRDPNFQLWVFNNLSSRTGFASQARAQKLIDDGNRLIAEDRINDLRAINEQLDSLLPPRKRSDTGPTYRVGIG